MIGAEWLLRLDLWGFRIFSTIFPIIWQSSILLFTAGVLSRLLRDRGAAVRHALWAGAVLAIPLLPLLSWISLEFDTPRAIIKLMPSSRDRIPEDFTQFRERTPHANTVIPDTGEKFLAPGGIITAGSPPVKPGHPFFQISPWVVFLVMYGAGTAAFLLFFLLGRVRIRWMIIKGKEIANPAVLGIFSDVRSLLGIRRKVCILESVAVETPLTARSLTPVVFLPQGFTETLSNQEIRALALHELSHVQRWDSFTLSLVSLIRALFFLHPLVWIAIHLMAKYAEVACDNAVVRYSGEPLAYAKMLARIAEQILSRNAQIQLAAGFMFSKSSFFSRIEAILSDQERMRKVSRTAFIGTAAASLGAFGIVLAFPLGEIDTPKTPPITVRGKVVFQNRPVFGASVYLVSRSGDENMVRIKKVTWSERNGAFHFKAPLSTFDGIQGNGIILVRHPDHAIGFVSLRDYENSGYVFIPLEKSKSISGKIMDNEGNPLPKAQVKILGMARRDFTGDQSVYMTLAGALENILVKSNRHGRFRVRGIPDLVNVSFVIEHEGFAKGYVSNVPSGTDNAACTLSPEGCIQGRVVNGLTGNPVRNMTVFARASRLEEGWGKAKTDRSGKFRMTGLPKGLYTVFVENSAEWVAVMRRDISVRPGETCSGIDFSLCRGGFVTGRVVESASGKPVPNCRMFIADAGFPDQLEAVKSVYTDLQGLYRFRAAPGEAVVSISGTPPNQLVPDAPASHTVVVVEGTVMTGIDFRLMNGTEAAGIVRAPDGRPIPGAKIIQRPINTGSVHSDEKGRFTVPRLKSGEKKVLQAVSPDGRFRGLVSVDVHPGTVFEIKTNQCRMTSMDGIVSDHEGNPVAGVVISLAKQMDQTNRFRVMNAACSDSGGRFQIRELEVGGSYAVFPSAQGLPPRDQWLVIREDMPPVKIMVEKAEGWLEGTITDSANRPLPGVEILTSSLISSPGGFRMAVTDDRGYYRLEGLADSRTRIHLRKKGYGYYLHEITLLSRKQDFVLVRAERYVSGVVTDDEGNPLPNVSVSIKQTPESDLSGYAPLGAITDKDGQFRLGGLLTEEVVLRLFCKDIGESEFRTETNREGITLVMKESSESINRKEN